MDSDSYLFSLFASVEVTPMTTGSIVVLVLVLFCLFISALVSASETAFFSLSSDDMKEIRTNCNSSDRKIDTLLSRPEYLLATILIVNNLANISVIVLSVGLLNTHIDFTALPYSGFWLQVVALMLMVLCVGEVAPKIYARRNSLRVARSAAATLLVLDRMLRFLTNLMVRSVTFVNVRMAHKEPSLSMEDLSQAVEITHIETGDEKEMLQDIVKFGDKTAQEIMTARADLTDVDIHTEYDELLRLIVDTGYSRIPVYEGTQDNIKGIIYIKDLLSYLSKDKDFEWARLLRPAYFVPESKPIDDLLEEFRRKKIHMAIVVDEFGGTSGIVTLEDVLEEIVGEISDEYDEEETSLSLKIDENSYLFYGKTPIDDFYEIVGSEASEFKLDDEPDTLAGLILSLKEDFPRQGEKLSYGRFTFHILKMDKYRIERVKVTILPHEESES